MARVIKTSDSKEHLCDTCPKRPNFPYCEESGFELEFGDGIGNDNIISCGGCTSPYSKTIGPSNIVV